MNDEFLHRLRKEPRPEFARRLRSQLRRQSASEPRVPSRTRTLLGLLLLGGAAFAITGVTMRGLPPSVLELYRHLAARIAAEHAAPAHPAGNEDIGEGLRWATSGSGSAPGAVAPRGGGTTESAAHTTNARSAATPSTASGGGSATVGAPGLRTTGLTAVSSWAAYPYAARIAELVNSATGMTGGPTAPRIDVSIGDSGHALRRMCSGGPRAPDMVFTFGPAGSVRNPPCPSDASGNAILVLAFPVGHEVLDLARSPLYGAPALTRRQVFLALAKWVPDPTRSREVRENFYTNWRQIDAALGPEPLRLLGPPLASAAGRSMIELLMEGGCSTYPWIAALASSDPKQYARICRTVRTDGVYSEIPYLSPSDLLAQPNAVGIVGSQYGPNNHGLAVSALDGVEPTRQSVASGAYPGSRVFYLVVSGRVGLNVMVRLLNAAWDPGYAGPWAVVAPPQSERQATIHHALFP